MHKLLEHDPQPIDDWRIGDGYRPAFVLEEREETVLLFVQSKPATVSVPRAVAEKARQVSYQPRQVRSGILERARRFRQHGRRFPRKATVQMLRLLGVRQAIRRGKGPRRSARRPTWSQHASGG